MKTMLVRGLLAFTLCACGGGMDVDTATEESGTDTPAKQLTESAVIDTVQWRDTTVQFINASGDEQEPVVLTTRQGNMADGDPLALLEDQAGMTVTAAELWMALTGREDVPELLALDHINVASVEGRTTEYQHYDLSAPTTRKVIATSTLHSLFPVIDSTHCWTSIRGSQVSVGPFFGHTQSYACTSNNPSSDQSTSSFVRFAPVTLASACPTSFNSTSSVRVGVLSGGFIGQATTDIEQVCFDVGSGWTCLNAVLFKQGFQFVSDLGASTIPHRIGMGVTSSADNIMSYGAARVLNKPPITSTNGFCN
jgi:hypothetical protein